MNRATITTIIIFSLTGLLIAYDVWAAFQPGGTISEVMLKLGHAHPIIPFALGVLVGHFYFSQVAEAEWQEQTTPIRAGAEPLFHRRNALLWLGLGCLAVGVILLLLGR